MCALLSSIGLIICFNLYLNFFSINMCALEPLGANRNVETVLHTYNQSFRQYRTVR